MVRSIMLRFSAVLAVVFTAGVVVAVTGPSATAANGDPVILGNVNSYAGTTSIHNEGSFGLIVVGATDGLYGEGGIRGVSGQTVSSTGAGVWGHNGLGNGVYGETITAAGSGVYGSNTAAGNGVSGVAPTGNGVYGNGGLYGVYGESTGTAVFGTNTGSGNGVVGLLTNGASAVAGQNFGTGIGVNASAPSGTAVHADSASGIALEIDGRSTFSTAGTAVIASGKKSVTVTLAGVTTSDFVLATVQGSGAFFVKNASAGSGKFTITINKAPTAPAKVKVAFFVISAS